MIRAHSSFQKVGHMGGTSYLFLIWTLQCEMVWYSYIVYIKASNNLNNKNLEW